MIEIDAHALSRHVFLCGPRMLNLAAHSQHPLVDDIGECDRIQKNMYLPSQFLPQVVRHAAPLLTRAPTRRSDLAARGLNRFIDRKHDVGDPCLFRRTRQTVAAARPTRAST